MNTQMEIQQIFRQLDSINLQAIILIIAGSWLLIFVVQRLLRWLAARLPSRYRFYILPLAPIFRIVVLIFVAVRVLFLVIQPTTENLLAIAGASAVALGFAFKDYASSIIAGIVALYERPYRSGDWIHVDGDYGEVRSMGLRAVRIVTLDDDLVTIPHAKIWNANIRNANDGSRTHMCVAPLFAHPDHDARHARQVLRDVALTSPYTDLSRPITVVVDEQPWMTRYRIKAYPMDGRSQVEFTTDLTIRGKAALADLSIEQPGVPISWSESAERFPPA